MFGSLFISQDICSNKAKLPFKVIFLLGALSCKVYHECHKSFMFLITASRQLGTAWKSKHSTEPKDMNFTLGMISLLT